MNEQALSIDVEMLEKLPAKTLLTFLEYSRKTKANIVQLQQAIIAFAPLFRRLEDLDIDVSFNLQDAYISLTFTGDGARLRDVWVELRRNGWKPDTHPKKGDTSFYAYWRGEGLVTFFMNFSGALCRRVVVGTKMVEQPIYETICGDALAIAEESATPQIVASNDIPF
jgi:hypothetical protein